MLACTLLAVITATDPQVVVFLGADCPMANLYANRLNALADRYPQVAFRAVNCSEQDSDAEVQEFGRRLKFPFSKDPAFARRLDATRSPEAFVLVHGRIAYRGRIDDQYTPGTNRSQPSRCDLEEAIKEVLAGKPVSVPVTEATGCRLSLPEAASGAITFEHVAPILHRKCAECHRPGQVAPFSLLRYQDTVGWGPTMREVIENGRMPPWHADPRHGRFSNDRSLTVDEKALLLRWLDGGAPPGKTEPMPPVFADGWKIRADVVLQMDRFFQVPAEGVLDYQEFVIDPHFRQDTWVQAVEIRPGSAAVHHINVYLRPAGAKNNTLYLNSMNDFYLAMTVPGNTVTSWPAGVAKLIPAGWNVIFSVHYQPNGSQQQDRSSLALQLADPQSVRQQVATRVFLRQDLVIPPKQQTTISYDWTLEDNYTLYALYPHMHLRGQSMVFEIISPRPEILLNVPKYDFNWQHRYVLQTPRKLAKGTVIRSTAVFDNTAGNPNNPDPQATVRFGKQSTDEMFQACFEVARTHENRAAFNWRLPLAGLAGLLLLSYLTVRRVSIRDSNGGTHS